ncbi:MAG: spermidine/putrescine ABC transporter substrate-binding protein [Patescibacteria group bacterium]
MEQYKLHNLLLTTLVCKAYDPGNKFSIPFQYSACGIGVDTSKVKNFKKSWSLLFDEKYKGKISMLDDIRYGMVPALKTLGYSLNTTNETELSHVRDLLLRQKSLVRAYTSDTYIDLLKSGEVWIAYGYTGDIYQAIKENSNIVYFIPEEGSALAVESMCILKGAKNKKTAEQFMNYILEPQVDADIVNHTQYATPNDSAKQFINPKILNDENIFPGNSVFLKSEYIRDLGKANLLYDKLWTEIKTK